METIYNYIRTYILAIIAWIESFDDENNYQQIPLVPKRKRRHFLTQSQVFDIEELVVSGLTMDSHTCSHISKLYNVSTSVARNILLGTHTHSSIEYKQYLIDNNGK